MPFSIKSYYLTTLLFIFINLYASAARATDFVNAGPPVINIEKIGKNKLNSVNLMLQDNLGFMWLIKKDGLFRYDSKELKQFPGHEQFSMDKVTAMVEGRPGHIWIATRTSGLVHFNTFTAELTFHNLEEAFNVIAPTNEVDLLTYKDKTLYLTIKNQLLLIDEANLTVKKRTLLPITESDFVVSIMVTSIGDLWFSSLDTNGVFLLADDKVHHYQHIAGDVTTIASKFIPTIFEDSKARMWFGTIKGLALYIPESESFVNLQPIDMSLEKNKDQGAYANVLTSIVEDPQGILWLGLFHSGLFNFDPETQVFKHFPRRQGVNSTVLDNSIDGGLFFDNQETLWVLNRKGISQLDQNNRTFSQWVNIDPDSNNDCTPFNVHEANNNLYFDCFNTLNKINGEQVTKVLKIKDKIRSSTRTNDNLVWLGTMGGGVYRHNLQTNETKQYLLGSADATYVNSVKQLRPDVNNVLYGITNDHPEEKGSGIIRYDASSDSFEQFSVGLELIDFIDIDSKKMLLITSYNHYEKALYLFDKKTQQVEQLPLVTGEIFAALKWHDTIWLSSQKLGLITLDPSTNKIQQLETRILKTINGFYLDNANQELYLSTAKQLFRVDHISASNIDTLCITCTLNIDYQGINLLGAGQFVSSNSTVLDGRRFFISAKNKLLAVKLPDKKSEDKTKRLQLTGFKVLNKQVFPDKANNTALLKKSIEYTQQLTIPPGVNLFSFNFAQIDYLNNQQTNYHYKLEGLNEHWLETDSEVAEAVYSLLSPGDYIFKAMTSKPRGDDYKDQGAISLNITVLPHWWQTWWAYSLYLLFIIGIIFSVFWLYSRKKIAENAKNNALQLSKSKENLFANISHEFRTPLTLILGPAKVIHNSSNDKNTQNNASLIERNALRLLAMVDQLLQLAQLKNTEINTTSSQNVAKVCQFTLQSFNVIAIEKQIDLKLEGAIDDAWWVAAEQNTIETILYNLLSNAIKFTPAGGRISLKISAQGQWFEFAVTDSGYGIAEQDQEKIFERFTRLKNESYVPGAGIGLALVKELIETFGGKISVESQLNQGARFSFTLPKANASFSKTTIEHQPTQSLPQNQQLTQDQLGSTYLVKESANGHDRSSVSITVSDAETGTDTDNNHLSKPSVLIVDDNQEMREFIKTGLADTYLIIEAENGQQALTQALAHSPDIIISDVMMPIMDGFELLTSIRNEIAVSHIPVILLTAKCDQQSKLKGLSGLADDYITKPFDSSELLIRVRRLLGIRGILQKRFNQIEITDENKTISNGNSENIETANETENLSLIDQKFLMRFKELIEQGYSNSELSLPMISSQLAMSDRQLQRKLKAISGVSFNEMLREYRLTQGRLLLNNGEQIAVIADQVGFTSSSYFVRCFKAKYGKPPNDYRKAS